MFKNKNKKFWYSASLKERWQRWLDRRIPASEKIELSQKSIFIVPSQVGFAFSLLLILLLVTAINYQNSLIYGLTFWLFSVAMSAMLFSYRNLSGLIFKTSHAVKGFAGENIEVPLRIISKKRDYQGLEIAWPQTNETNSAIAVIKGDEKEITIPLLLLERGYLQTPRLRLRSYYPFGLYKCWTWLRLKTPGIIYPTPIFIPFIASLGSGDDMPSDVNLLIGNDEFIGLRNYRGGDSLKHVAWKYLAKGKGLLSKEYDNQQLSMQWLDWYSLQGMSLEERLSHLCGWVLQAEKEGRAYGLRLPTLKIEPGYGDKHREQCLTQLAIYNAK